MSFYIGEYQKSSISLYHMITGLTFV